MAGEPVYLDDMGHLWSRNRDTLHAMAAAIGMKRAWFQDRPRLYHYDVLSDGKRRTALLRGAISVTARELVAHIQEADRLRETGS